MTAVLSRTRRPPDVAGLPPLRLGPEQAPPKAQTIWALVSVIVVTVVLGTLGVLYLRPPGYVTHHLSLPEAGGLRGGEGVRVAGIPVGKVLSLHLRDDDVDVEFSVKSSVRLGDGTAVDVRMLTPVGGLYLALLPSGTQPLRGRIPAARAHLPFVVNDLVAQSKSVAERVDVDTLRRNMSGAAAALSSAPDAVRGSVTDLQRVVELFATQKQQIEDLVGLSNEYLEAVHHNQAILTEVVRAYAVLGPQIVAAREKVRVFADATAAIVGSLFEFLAGPYSAKVEPLFTPLEQTRDMAGQMSSWADRVTQALTRTITELGQLAGPDGRALVDQSGLTVPAPDICLPMPGKAC